MNVLLGLGLFVVPDGYECKCLTEIILSDL